MVISNRNRFNLFIPYWVLYLHCVLTLHINLLPVTAAVTALEALTRSVTPSAPPRGLAAPARGQLRQTVAVGPSQAAAGALCGGCFPFAQELHSSFSPWLWPFLELGCSCDPTDPAALYWLYPRPTFSPWTCPPVTELVAEPGFCRQTSLRYCGIVPLVHDGAPCCLAASLRSQLAEQPILFAPRLQLHKHVV